MKEALERGFGIVRLDEEPLLLVLASSPSEVRTTIEAAYACLEMSMIVAFMTVYAAGHEQERRMPLVIPQEGRDVFRRGLEKWLGADPLAAFPGVQLADEFAEDEGTQP